MIHRKRRMAAVALIVTALASIAFLSFRNDLIPRSLAERLFPPSASSAPSAAVAAVFKKERPPSQAPIALKAQPPQNFILTSERFVKNENKPPVKAKTQDGT